MTSAEITQREKKLIRAQERAAAKPRSCRAPSGGPQTLPPSLMAEHRAQVRPSNSLLSSPPGAASAGQRHRITIGLSLSRRDVALGHPATVTRQTAFDLNQLQDREYKYVSSTDAMGWRGGGGEGPVPNTDDANDPKDAPNPAQPPPSQQPKTEASDTVHVPISTIDCASSAQVDQVVAALARGEVFIPHMSVLPASLGVNGVSPPDLVLNFACERNDDLPPEEWPNWCLEFMHNQLYDYFSPILGVQTPHDRGGGGAGASSSSSSGGGTGVMWTPRPFQTTLARKVRWKTVKHMNKFFSQSEKVVQQWRTSGPQHLDPSPEYIEGGATHEEVSKPHGLYLIRNGEATNYFPPNFQPPYSTKMTRSLLGNVLAKRRDLTWFIF